MGSGYAYSPHYQKIAISNAAEKDAKREGIQWIYDCFMENNESILNDMQKKRAYQAYLSESRGKDLEMSLKYILKTPDQAL